FAIGFPSLPQTAADPAVRAGLTHRAVGGSRAALRGHVAIHARDALGGIRARAPLVAGAEVTDEVLARVRLHGLVTTKTDCRATIVCAVAHGVRRFHVVERALDRAVPDVAAGAADAFLAQRRDEIGIRTPPRAFDVAIVEAHDERVELIAERGMTVDAQPTEPRLLRDLGLELRIHPGLRVHRLLPLAVDRRMALAAIARREALEPLWDALRRERSLERRACGVEVVAVGALPCSQRDREQRREIRRLHRSVHRFSDWWAA